MWYNEASYYNPESVEWTPGAPEAGAGRRWGLSNPAMSGNSSSSPHPAGLPRQPRDTTTHKMQVPGGAVWCHWRWVPIYREGPSSRCRTLSPPHPGGSFPAQATSPIAGEPRSAQPPWRGHADPQRPPWGGAGGVLTTISRYCAIRPHGARPSSPWTPQNKSGVQTELTASHPGPRAAIIPHLSSCVQNGGIPTSPAQLGEGPLGGHRQVLRGGHGTGTHWVQLLGSLGLLSTAAHYCHDHSSFLDRGDHICMVGHMWGHRQPPTPVGPPGIRTRVPHTVSVVMAHSRAQDVDRLLEGSRTPGEGVRGSLRSPAYDGRVHRAGADLPLCEGRRCPPQLGSLRCPSQPPCDLERPHLPVPSQRTPQAPCSAPGHTRHRAGLAPPTTPPDPGPYRPLLAHSDPSAHEP